MKRLTQADREEIIESIKAELAYVKAEFIGVAPDWEPLHKLLPPDVQLSDEDAVNAKRCSESLSKSLSKGLTKL